jgi:hypothetical protein
MREYGAVLSSWLVDSRESHSWGEGGEARLSGHGCSRLLHFFLKDTLL